jgi:DNA-binding Lrp family transcriptional regulator
MTTEEEISKNLEELNEARQDFRDTMTELARRLRIWRGTFVLIA